MGVYLSELRREKIDKGRICQWGLAVVVFLAFVVLGIWATLDWPCEGISKELFRLFGFLSLGSLGALFTAFRSAMDRVPYHSERPPHIRAFLCIQRASRLEAVFRVLIGATVGGGAHWLANMA